MSLNVNDLAEAINIAIDAKDKDGNAQAVTPEQETYAEAIINTLTTAVFTNLPGTVTGTAGAPGGPLAAGAALNGKLVPPLTSGLWLTTMLSGLPTANPANLSTEATASTTYLTAAASFEFTSGNITGICGHTPTTPGPLVGEGMQGTITGLDGNSWFQLVAPPDADPILSENIYNAIVTYLEDNLEGSYLTGTVVGTCPPGGGPLTLGAGTGGIIS